MFSCNVNWTLRGGQQDVTQVTYRFTEYSPDIQLDVQFILSKVVLLFSPRLWKMMMFIATFHLGIRHVICSFFLGVIIQNVHWCWTWNFRTNLVNLNSILGELERLLHKATLMKTESERDEFTQFLDKSLHAWSEWNLRAECVEVH